MYKILVTKHPQRYLLPIERHKDTPTWSILLIWMVGSSNLLWRRGRVRSTHSKVLLPWRTVAMAMMQSVSKSVLASCRVVRVRFT